MIELFPLPVWPTSAMVCPGSAVKSIPRSTGLPGIVRKTDPAKLDLPRGCGPQRHGVRRVLPVRPAVEQVEHALRPGHRRQRLVVLLPDDLHGLEEQRRRGRKTGSGCPPASRRAGSSARQPPSSSRMAMKNWLFNSSSGRKSPSAAPRRNRSGNDPPPGRGTSPALTSCRTNPCVTRMPLTDSASVAVIRLKLSCCSRYARLSRPRKCRLMTQINGAMASTAQNSTQSHTASAPRRSASARIAPARRRARPARRCAPPPRPRSCG